MKPISTFRGYLPNHLYFPRQESSGELLKSVCFCCHSVPSPLDLELSHQGWSPERVHHSLLAVRRGVRHSSTLLPRTVQGCLVGCSQPLWKVGTSTVYLTNETFWLTGTEWLPQVHKGDDMRDRIEKKPTLSISNAHALFHPTPCPLHVTFWASIASAMKKEWWYLLCAPVCVKYSKYKMLPNTTLDIWPESDKCHWMNGWMDRWMNEWTKAILLYFHSSLSTDLHPHSPSGLPLAFPFALAQGLTNYGPQAKSSLTPNT